MSKFKESASAENPSGALPAASQPSAPLSFFPKALWLAFAGVILAGALILITRTARTEAAALDALTTCEASVLSEADGLSDVFGTICLKRHRAAVANYLSLCDKQPESALRVFRRVLESKEKSARLVAIYSGFFLAQRNMLEAADLQKIAGCLDGAVEKETDVRRAAQRLLSDLLILSTPKAKEQYERLPENLPAVPPNGTAHKIQTLESGPGGQRFLRLRWSNPDLAAIWWKEHQSSVAWSADRHAYVIP